MNRLVYVLLAIAVAAMMTDAKCTQLNKNETSQDNYSIVETEVFTKGQHNQMEAVHTYQMVDCKTPCELGY